MPSNTVAGIAGSTNAILGLKEQLKLARKEERKLRDYLKDLGSDASSINGHLARYQICCEQILFEDFDIAIEKKIEELLWDMHIGANGWYRRVFKKLEKNKNKHVVEQRKVTKKFVEFIKSGQIYYRRHISQLATNFGSIQELEVIAKKISADDLKDAREGAISSELHSKVLNSCFSALIRLGDLSRWREQKRAEDNPNWGPAIGYYDLAATLRPESGIPHNQLAVIAAASKTDNLRVVYHFYRSLSTKEPHPTAHSNLVLEFRKILNPARTPKPVLKDSDMEADTSDSDLVDCFVSLHAKCMAEHFPNDYKDMRHDMINKLVAGVKERLIPSTFQKIVLVNLAAEYVITKNSEDDENQFPTFTDLNISTFTALLRLIVEELESQNENDVGGVGKIKAADKVTAVMHRVLPGIRHYSSWLLYSMESSISASKQCEFPMGMRSTLQDLWAIYSRALTTFIKSFDVADLPDIEYLLEEDEDTIGFIPFKVQSVQDRFMRGEKPKPYGHLVARHHPTQEMLGRIKDFLRDGLQLVGQKAIPIQFQHGGGNSRPTFLYEPPEEPSVPIPSPEPHHFKCTEVTRSRSSTISSSSSLQHEQMVIDLVEPNTSPSAQSYELNCFPSSSPGPVLHSPAPARVSTPPAYSFEDPNFDVDPFAAQVQGEFGTSLNGQVQLMGC